MMFYNDGFDLSPQWLQSSSTVIRDVLKKYSMVLLALDSSMVEMMPRAEKPRYTNLSKWLKRTYEKTVALEITELLRRKAYRKNQKKILNSMPKKAP